MNTGADDRDVSSAARATVAFVGSPITASAFRAVLAAVVVLTLTVSGRVAFATPNPVPVQFFYMPFPEDQLLQGLQAIDTPGGSPDPVSPVTTYISIAAIANNTIVYYDQWENGYDPDIANPLNLYSGGNPGGTQIWGDATLSTELLRPSVLAAPTPATRAL